MVVRVKTSNDKPLPNIIVATDNLAKENIQLKSDKNGIANFLDKCATFKNAYNPQTQKGVRICAYDQSGNYKKACIVITNKSNCDETIRLSLAPLTPGKKYPSPEQMGKLALNRQGQLRLFPVCDPNYTEYPADVIKHCVNDFFKSTDVQMLEAVQLAKLYAKQKHNHDIVCSGTKYRPYKNDDYLQCTSKDAKHVYEFRFDDLDEPVARTIQKNTANALCRLPGGKYDSTYDYCQKDSQTEQICSGINTNASQFGWSAQYYKSKTIASSTATLGNGQQTNSSITRENLCAFDFKTKDSNYALRADQDGLLDPYAFQQIQVKSNRDTTLLLNQYVRAKIGAKFKSLQCDNGFTIMYRDNIHTDNVITCHLTTTNNSVQDIDFVFDDVNEKNKTKTAGGTSGMSCISNNGQFDGKNCVGIGRIQCRALNYKLPGGTTFDEKLGLCKLKAAQNADDLAKFEKGMTVAGTIVVGVALTVATAGTGASAVLALTATGLSSAAGTTSAILKNIQNEYARDFVVAAEQCGSAETCSGGSCSIQCNPNSLCAKDTLANGYADIKNILTQSPSNQLAQAVITAHDNLWIKISEKCVDKTFKDNLNKKTSKLGTWIEVADWTSMATDIFSITSATKAGSKMLLKLGSKATGGGKAFSLGVRNPKALKVLEKLGSMDDYSSIGEAVRGKL